MKDFLRVLLLLIIVVAVNFVLILLFKINVFILALICLAATVTLIGGGVLYFRKKIAYHNLPKDKQKEHLKEYKESRKNNPD